jgi:glycosyltransferase involved in cell wall biosynthesis
MMTLARPYPLKRVRIAAAFLRGALQRRRVEHMSRGPGGTPVAVLGYLQEPSGLGESARLLVAGLRSAGVTTFALDVADFIGSGAKPRAEALRSVPTAQTLVTVLNPPELLALAGRFGPPLFRAKRHVGYWAWELPDIAPDWLAAYGLVDAVWCPSAFTRDAVLRSGLRLPIEVISHPVLLGPVGRPDRVRFRLPTDALVVLTAFDLRSTTARKNPEGALDAFRRMSSSTSRRVLLLCKVTGSEEEPDAWTQLHAQFADDDRVVLMVEHLTRPAMNDLIASVDIVLSLHRAEGFGLVLAEAMRHAVPTVATGWSGNLDFSDPQSAALTPYSLVPVIDVQGRYSRSVWADPDLEAAASLLLELIESDERRLALGVAGRRKIERALDLQSWGETVRRALLVAR